MPETRRMIRGYNHLAQVLVEYELIQLKEWKQKMKVAKESLLSSVLVRHDGRLLVNFDPKIIEFFREVQVLQGMGIEIPPEALALYAKKSSIMENFEMIQVSMLKAVSPQLYLIAEQDVHSCTCTPNMHINDFFN